MLFFEKKYLSAGSIMILFLFGFSGYPDNKVLADFSIIRDSVILFNTKQYKESLSDGSYRGEAGILGLKPETAQQLGMKVFMASEYQEAVGIYKTAETYKKKIADLLASQGEEIFKGEYSRKIATYAFFYNSGIKTAESLMKIYNKALQNQKDDRFDKKKCGLLMEKLLKENFLKTCNNLRDGLGCFYNQCRGINGSDPLTPDNILFVNFVYRNAVEKGSDDDLKSFDLDRCVNISGKNNRPDWKNAAGKIEEPYLVFIEKILDAGGSSYSLDPLLFMALMKRESHFDSGAVSYVGAAGLTQIMPLTAKNLGMKTIHMGASYVQGQALLAKERALRSDSYKIIDNINSIEQVELAGQARKLMQESLAVKEKRELMFSGYRQELLNDADDRLDPEKAIEFGFRYFAGLMQKQKCDISLALASYNAGPHRVTQYNGIPPFGETVTFRNQVLKYYREYLKKLAN